MKTAKISKSARLAMLLAVGGLALGACSSDDSKADDTTPAPEQTTIAPDTTVAPDTTPEAKETIVDIAVSKPDFSTLVAAVKAAGLAETLSGPGPFTVFAPTNDAFAKLPAATLESLLKPENKDQLAGILTYHVVGAKVMAADVKPGAVKTVNGAEFTVSVEGSDVIITDGQGNKSKVVTTDVEASNGVIHVIDTVLLPPQG